jgi:hypothetical protein
MAHQVVLLYDSDTSKFLEVDGDHSVGHSGVGSNTPSVASHSESMDWASSIFGLSVILEAIDVGSSISTAYCQCGKEDTLVECHTCGSFCEPDTYCPGC